MSSSMAIMRQKMEKAGLIPLRTQAELSEKILRERLETILPAAMEETGIDFWLVIGSEYNEDPIFRTLFAWDMPTARRVSALAFSLQDNGNVRRYSLGARSPIMDQLYENKLTKGNDFWETLKNLIVEISPSKIGINQSDHSGICDGLSSSHYQKLQELPCNFIKDRLVSAHDLAVAYMKRLTELELEALKTVVEVTQDIIDLTYSKDAILLGKTTTTDLEWFMRQCITELGCQTWFGPDVNLQRVGDSDTMISDALIQPGDLLHCDIGMTPLYIKLHSDIQRLFYIPKPGEEDVPIGIQEAMKRANRFQDIVMQTVKPEKTGNEVFSQSIAKGNAEGLNPCLYSHPIGSFGHGPGTMIGRYDEQKPIPIKGDYPVGSDTVYALELNCWSEIPEWNKQKVFIYLEEDIFCKTKADYLQGRQTVIRSL